MINHFSEVALHKLIRVFILLDRRFISILIYGIALLFATSEGYFLVSALETEKIKPKIFVITVPLFIFMIAIFQRIRIQKTVALLLMAFWIPIGLGTRDLYLCEIFTYVISFLLIIKFPRLDDEKHSDNEMIKSFLKNFPWFPFLLYILGALLTWSLSTKTGGEINIIRVQCIFPLALSLVLFVTVRSEEDAELFLWTILTSAAILALLFLVGRYFTNYITLSSYATDSGRLSMSLEIPHMGDMEMLPQRTSNVFSYLLVFAYSLWIFHPSPLHRTYALFLCLLFGLIIITTQGRGGAITSALGAAIISIYAAFKRRAFGINGAWIKFAVVGLAVIGGLWYLSTHSTNAIFYQHGISLFVDPQQDENLLGRFQRWSDGIKLFMANPIFGTGLRGYETPWGLDTSELLNIFLYTVLSFGLLGFIGFSLIFLRFLGTFWNGIQFGDCMTRMLCIASICGMLGFFFGLQSLEPYSMVIIWTPLVLTFAVSKLNGNQSVKNPRFVNVMK